LNNSRGRLNLQFAINALQRVIDFILCAHYRAASNISAFSSGTLSPVIGTAGAEYVGGGAAGVIWSL